MSTEIVVRAKRTAFPAGLDAPGFIQDSIRDKLYIYEGETRSAMWINEGLASMPARGIFDFFIYRSEDFEIVR